MFFFKKRFLKKLIKLQKNKQKQNSKNIKRKPKNLHRQKQRFPVILNHIKTWYGKPNKRMDENFGKCVEGKVVVDRFGEQKCDEDGSFLENNNFKLDSSSVNVTSEDVNMVDEQMPNKLFEVNQVKDINMSNSQISESAKKKNQFRNDIEKEFLLQESDDVTMNEKGFDDEQNNEKRQSLFVKEINKFTEQIQHQTDDLYEVNDVDLKQKRETNCTNKIPQKHDIQNINNPHNSKTDSPNNIKQNPNFTSPKINKQTDFLKTVRENSIKAMRRKSIESEKKLKGEWKSDSDCDIVDFDMKPVVLDDKLIENSNNNIDGKRISFEESERMMVAMDERTPSFKNFKKGIIIVFVEMCVLKLYVEVCVCVC